jgi:lon-related putative ATP-dependent protease
MLNEECLTCFYQEVLMARNKSKTDALKPLKNKPKSLPSESLRWRCPEDVFDYKSAQQQSPKQKIIGQERAIEAIRTGLGIRKPGFNIFVSGLTGTGRSTTVRQILASMEKINGKIDDKLYVHNFKDPDYPRLIRLPAGQGKTFKKDMERLLAKFQEQLPGMFESDRFKSKLDALTEKYRERQRALFNEFEKKANEAGFAVVQIQMGNFSRPDLLPIYEDKPVSFDDLDKLVGEEKFDSGKAEELKKAYPKVRSKLESILTRGRKIEHELQEEREKLIVRFGLPCVESYIDDIREKYSDEKVKDYLDEIQEYTLDNIQIFTKKDDAQSKLPMLMSGGGQPQDPFKLYGVNLLVNNSGCKKPPVINETSPNYKNLFGTIEKEMEPGGGWTSDFMNIKAGSLLRADGGVLVLNLLEAISEPFVWTTLKRTLKYTQLQIEAPEALFFGQSALKPEPVQLDLKVVLIGDKQHYLLLFNYDDSFKKIFKICADFSDEMPRTPKNIQKYANFIARLSKRENLLPFTSSGVAAIVEESLRMTGRQGKLSALFSDIADIAREASYWADLMKSDVIARNHIERSIREQKNRRSLIEEKVSEYITDGLIMIDTSGSKKGVINGLAVYNYGEYMFGKPARITTTISLGKTGVINIEREAELSGKIHDKGIAILSGFLRQRFAQNKPLAFSASICFEQSYSGIDGDSASSTELYLLLAALADVPVRQDIAVTGSVNQYGEIQPIGGVNEKIEGFFSLCKKRRLTGKQGVIIPHQNVNDLQLDHDVLDAVKEGKFHVYPVKTIDEGLEILTGYKTGKCSPGGQWEKNTLMHRVDSRLHELALGIQKFYEDNSKKTKDTVSRPPKEPPCPPTDPRQPTRKKDDDK